MGTLEQQERDLFEKPAPFKAQDLLAKPSDRAQILCQALTENPSNKELTVFPLLIDSEELYALKQFLTKEDIAALTAHPCK